jgi:uridine kinase
MYGSIAQLNDVAALVEARLAAHQRTVLVLEGMSAAGKTTAALALAQRWQAPVVHMDDFFLPPNLRTPERLAQPGGNVHYERFAQEVLPGLRAGESFSYGVFQCSTMTIGATRPIPAAPVTIIEGAYAMHPYFEKYGDITVFFAIDPAQQKRRILARSGPDRWPDFRDCWIPLENAYHKAYHVRETADFVV